MIHISEVKITTRATYSYGWGGGERGPVWLWRGLWQCLGEVEEEEEVVVVGNDKGPTMLFGEVIGLGEVEPRGETGQATWRNKKELLNRKL